MSAATELARLFGPDAIEALVRLVDERVESVGAARAMSEYVTPDEAAEILRCSRQRIYDLASAGRLTRLKEGGRTLHRRADVLALVLVDR